MKDARAKEIIIFTCDFKASAAEELASAAEELSGQAERLKGTIGFFKLDDAGCKSPVFDNQPAEAIQQFTSDYRPEIERHKIAEISVKNTGPEEVAGQAALSSGHKGYAIDMSGQAKNGDRLDGEFERY